jgi:accessory secretory protein Asp2
MSQDEYDGQSLGQLLDFFAKHNVPVKHESEEGQHTEKLDEMVDFIMTNLNVLQNTMRAEGE